MFDPAVVTAAAKTVLDDTTTAAMLTTLGGAPLASPVFTGDPQAPTAALGDADTSIATTAFVSAAVSNTFAGGMSTAEYTYSTTTTTPPSTGQLRANTTTQTAITAFYLHETNAVGIDITNALKLISTGVKILCQDKTDASKVQYYVVTGPAVDNGVYFTIPVVWTTGGSNFTAGRVIFAGFGIGSNNMPEAPTDGAIYGRRGSDSSWQVATGTFTDAPSDSAEYVRINGVWRAKAQSFDVGGLASKDITVPTTAKRMRLNVVLWTASSQQSNLLVSGDGTTFPTGASDYTIAGFQHQTGNSTFTAQTAIALNRIPIAAASNSSVVPVVAEVHMAVAKGGAFAGRLMASNYDTTSTIHYMHRFYSFYVNHALGSVTTLKAVRLSVDSGTWASASTIEVQWGY
jgi:hypothetical protein